MQSSLAGPEKTELAQADIDLVVRELSSGRSRDETCRILCAQCGYQWDNAQKLVIQVSSKERTRIARRQAPFLMALGIVTLLGGVLLLFGTTYGFLHYTHYYSVRTIRYLVVGFGLGVLMTLGSGIGLVQAVIAMWK